MNGDASHASPLVGKTFVLVGAGGAGRALAFGAKSRGAHVVIFNRNYGNRKPSLPFSITSKTDLFVLTADFSLFKRESKGSCKCSFRGSSAI